MELLKKDSNEKTQQIDALNEHIADLLEKLEVIRSELETKNLELMNLTYSNEQYAKESDDAYQTRLQKIEKDHATAMELRKKRENELEAQIRSLENQIKNKKVVETSEVQTDVSEFSFSCDENAKVVNQLVVKINELENDLKEKDDFIVQLHNDLIQCNLDEDHRETRSDKFQSTESNFPLRLKILNKLQTFVEKIMEKRDINSKIIRTVISGADGSENKETMKHNDREIEKKEKIAEKTRISHLPSAVHRSKSPSFLSRLRDRSPTKAKSPGFEMKSPEKKYLLSPSYAERSSLIDDRRRGSPSRQFFTRTKRDIGSSSQSGLLSPGAGKDDSSKRPAWKF
ncbi:unnamed protein product [Dracunculus medinensis]|uniref:GRIP domain-containing protein n=1 Tax=Dracunculus medinensis TaxID=318479 RepID=A0A0N4U452_DRAME|nr:unnamed protein product [Dracunculus medinensis]